MMRREQQVEQQDELEYWISYSDLMAGLLLVFIIILMGVMAVSKRDLEQREKRLEEAKAELAHLDQGIADILGVRAELMERIRKRFEKSGGDIAFDDATGAIRLGSNILFREGSARLTSKGQQTLAEFMPIYLDALLGDPELRKHIDRITFEGHTNSNYDGHGDRNDAYMYNLYLSQRRAYNAMRYVIESGSASQHDAKELLAASGFSFSRLLYEDAEGKIEDKDGSRRIEIRFRLKDEEALRRLKTLFDERDIEAGVD